MRVRSATTCGGSSRAPGARGEARGSWLCRTVCFQRLDSVGWVAYHEGFDAFCPGSERAASPIDDRRGLRSRRLDSQEPPNGAEQVVIEEMMVKKQQRNLMTENKPNEYPRTVLPASGGNVRRPIRSFAGAPAVEISSRSTNDIWARTGNSNLNIPEPGLIKGTLPRSELTGHDWFSMMPTDTSPKVCKVLLLFHLRQINNHHPHAEYGHQETKSIRDLVYKRDSFKHRHCCITITEKIER
ncbi:hypothetical protein pipiens_015405 [Culex pipiens pipiens]|uniref:Uncharacterized protein n=1 Tax=Culex pipiens pipiens TaxID=38569 RepID=A0ABD1CQL9_CULPP